MYHKKNQYDIIVSYTTPAGCYNILVAYIEIRSSSGRFYFSNIDITVFFRLLSIGITTMIIIITNNNNTRYTRWHYNRHYIQEAFACRRNVDGGVNYVSFLAYVYAGKVDIIIINNNNNQNIWWLCVCESYMRRCVRGVTTARGSRTAPTGGCKWGWKVRFLTLW